MNELQGLNGMKKCELIEESKEDEYILYGIDLWKMTIKYLLEKEIRQTMFNLD